MIGLSRYFAREMNIFLCGPTIPWTEIIKWLSNGNRSLRIFSNGFDMPLPTTVWVGLATLFPSAWWVVEDLCWA